MKTSSVYVALLMAVAMAAGALIGTGIGQGQVRKERKAAQVALEEKDRFIALIRNKLDAEMARAAGSLASREAQCREDALKRDAALKGERKRAGDLNNTVAELTAQSQQLEERVRTADAAAVRSKQDLQEAMRNMKDLDRELQRTSEEKQSLQTELKKKTKELNDRVATLSDQTQKLESRAKAADETAYKARLKLQEAEQNSKTAERDTERDPIRKLKP